MIFNKFCGLNFVSNVRFRAYPVPALHHSHISSLNILSSSNTIVHNTYTMTMTISISLSLHVPHLRSQTNIPYLTNILLNLLPYSKGKSGPCARLTPHPSFFPHMTPAHLVRREVHQGNLETPADLRPYLPVSTPYQSTTPQAPSTHSNRSPPPFAIQGSWPSGRSSPHLRSIHQKRRAPKPCGVNLT